MKKIVVVMGVMFILCITACGKTNQDSNKNKTVQVSISEDENGKVKETSLDLKHYALVYKAGSDQQNTFAWNEMAGSDLGYYMFGTGEYQDMLLFMDKKSGAVVPLCNKPNCEHEASEECNAYYAGLGTENASYDTNWLQYYDGKVYTIGCNEDGYVNLYKADADGSNRTASTTLYRINRKGSSKFQTPKLAIHRGYVYFINPNNKKPRLEMVKLGAKKKPTLIYEQSGTYPSMYRIEAYGDYVFFQAGYFEDEEMENMQGAIYAYNTQTNEVSCLKSGAVSSYMIEGDVLYYGTEQGIQAFHLKTKKEENCIETKDAYPDFTVCNGRVYLFGEDGIDAYGTDGKQIASLSSGEGVFEYYYGDADYLFAEGTKDQKMYSLSVKEFLKGNGEWKTMHVSQ